MTFPGLENHGSLVFALVGFSIPVRDDRVVGAAVTGGQEIGLGILTGFPPVTLTAEISLGLREFGFRESIEASWGFIGIANGCFHRSELLKFSEFPKEIDGGIDLGEIENQNRSVVVETVRRCVVIVFDCNAESVAIVEDFENPARGAIPVSQLFGSLNADASRSDRAPSAEVIGDNGTGPVGPRKAEVPQVIPTCFRKMGGRFGDLHLGNERKGLGKIRHGKN